VAVNVYPKVPVADGVPFIVNEEPEAVPVTPVGKLPLVQEIVAALDAVYTIVVIAVFWFGFWKAAPLVLTRVMVGTIVAATAVRVADMQPVAAIRACV
jgi:hypothetical protein